MPPANDKHKAEYEVWRRTTHGREVYDLFRFVALGKVKNHNTTRGSAQAIVYNIRQSVKSKSSSKYAVRNAYVKYLAQELTNSGVIPEGFFNMQIEEPVKTRQEELKL